jgi:hypothetical protein
MKEENFLVYNLFPKLVADTKDDMWYKNEQTVIKQIVKRLIDVTILNLRISLK